MAKYIFRSEKGKNTCDKCKSYDGKVFYDIKDIPELPIHPNCKCWIETVEDKVSKDEKCDCKDRVEKAITNYGEYMLKTDKIAEMIDLINLDFEYCCESLEGLIFALENKHSDIKKEMGKHKIGCKNNCDELFKEIASILLKLKEANNNKNNWKNLVYNFKKNLSDLTSSIKDGLFEVSVLRERTAQTLEHKREECGIIDLLKKYEKQCAAIVANFTDMEIKISEVKQNINQTQKDIINACEILKKARDFKILQCDCINETKATTMSIYEKVQEFSIKAAELRMPIASKNLQNGMDDFKKARENKETYVVDSPSDVPSKGVENLLKEVGVPKDSRGVVYMTNSEESKNLSKSNEIKKYIKDNKDKLTNNKENKVVDFEFNYTNLSIDAFAGIQHCKLYNPRITDDGYFEGIIVDYYDFAYRNSKNILQIPYNAANNFGYMMQEKGLLENYFNLYYIREKVN